MCTALYEYCLLSLRLLSFLVRYGRWTASFCSDLVLNMSDVQVTGEQPGRLTQRLLTEISLGCYGLLLTPAELEQRLPGSCYLVVEFNRDLQLLL